MKRYSYYVILLLIAAKGYSQALFVPSGTSGIGNNTTNSNVGIGISVPTTKLQVKGGAFQQINVDNGSGMYLDATAMDQPKIGWRVSDNSERFRIHFQGVNTANERLGFFKTLTGESEVFSVLANGNIGVGVSNPSSRLHVKNGAITSSTSTYDNINVRMDGRDIPSIKFTRWTGSNNLLHNAFVGQFQNTSAGNEYSLGLGVGVSYTGDQDAIMNAVTILTNGNVGIGTLAPPSAIKLQVKGGAFQLINVDNNSGIHLDAPVTNEAKIGWRVSDNSERFRIHFKGVNTSLERLAFFKTIGGEAEVLSVLASGSVGIGTTSPGSFKLAVNGKIWGQEVQVAVNNPGPDYVFEKDYALPTLESVKTYIDQNKHLP